ncbi:MAG: tRNA lysidine(34) synthetase TilS [Clostridia bacterium]
MNTELWDRWDMLPRGARVLCAVSGGADSMCLLHLLKSLENERDIRVFAAHFEHGLRGEESLRDMAFVENWCREHEIPCTAERGDTRALAAAEHLGLEEAARKLRYEFLERTAGRLGCGRIATAHTADDNAETLLLNLVRGSGTRGLGGIPPRRGKIVRPLLETERAEIEAYLKAHGVPHVEDGSNEDPAFSRNRLRHEVLPLLRELNPALNGSLGRTAALLRQDEDFLCGLAAEWLDENFDGGSLPLKELRALHPAVGTRVVRALCPQGLSAAQTESVLRFAEGTELGFLDLPGLRLRREQGRLFLRGEEPPEITPRRIVPGETTEFPELGLRVRAETVPAGRGEINSPFNSFCLGYERIKGELVCTGRRPGDRMHPLGRGLGKSLKALFLEAGMTRDERSRALVFRDDLGILAAFPLALDERAAPAPDEEALLLTVENMD